MNAWRSVRHEKNCDLVYYEQQDLYVSNCKPDELVNEGDELVNEGCEVFNDGEKKGQTTRFESHLHVHSCY